MLHSKLQARHTDIEVLKATAAANKEAHDREFKQLQESFKAVFAKLDGIEEALRKWSTFEGSLWLDIEYENQHRISRTYTTGDSIDIPPNTWHKATNIESKTAKVIEVWMGSELSEDDIERRD